MEIMEKSPTQTALSNAEDVARFFVQYYNDNNLPITNLMLNKLLYFAQGHCLAEYGRPLFDEKIEAWEYGPVVPTIYRKYKDNKRAPIETKQPVCYGDLFSDETIALLVAVARQYMRYSDWGLVEKSHKQGGAWSKVYVPGEKYVPIVKKDIEDDFADEELDDFADEEFTEEELNEFREISKAYRRGELETVSLCELV